MMKWTKKIFWVHPLGWLKPTEVYCTSVWSDRIWKKCFGIKMVLPNLKMAWASTHIMTLNQIYEKKLVWNSTTRGLGFPVAQKQLKIAHRNPSPLVVEFQIIFFSQIRFNVMIYVEAQAVLKFGSTIFMPKHFFHIWSLHTEVQ